LLRSLKVDNIVLKKEQAMATKSYKYSKVHWVHLGEEGHVRAVEVWQCFFSLIVFGGTEALIVFILLYRPSEDSMQ
jgi:hypothetical protein